jgi:hypothetical protein
MPPAQDDPLVAAEEKPPKPKSDRTLTVLTHLDDLSDDVVLNTRETAVVVNRSESTLKYWRLHVRNHPLAWQRQGKIVQYRLGDIRRYLHGDKEEPSRPFLSRADINWIKQQREAARALELAVPPRRPRRKTRTIQPGAPVE